MITKSNQNWQAGETVKIGFMSLRVLGAQATPGDYKPDAYILANAKGDKFYRFVPHNGLESISAIEAQAAIAEIEEAASRAMYRALARAAA